MALPFTLSPPLRGKLQLTPHGYFSADRPNRNGVHMGIDLAASQGDAVLSSTLGKVARTGFDKPVPEGGGGGGNFVIVTTGGYELGYMHLERIDVKPGDQVQAGEQLGTAGATGTESGGVHLHFQVAIPASASTNKRYFDPTSDLGLERPAVASSSPKTGGAGGPLLAVGLLIGLRWLWGRL